MELSGKKTRDDKYQNPKRKNIIEGNQRPISTHRFYQLSKIMYGDVEGIPSIAARHTALRYKQVIQLDAGFVPREIGRNIRIVLITHFHSDHGSDLCNCINDEFRVTVFCPAYACRAIFNKIKNDMHARKGREYSDTEISKMVRIIGCKRNNDLDQKRFGDSVCLTSDTENDVVIVELITVGDQIIIETEGRERYGFEPFACYHTVDTCGYVIYDCTHRLKDIINMSTNSYTDVNFTEDQIMNHESKQIYKSWEQNPKFSDVMDFSKRHNVKLELQIIETIKNPNFTLKTRRLHFPHGLNLLTKNPINNDCTLSSSDIIFLKKYQVNTVYNHLIPKLMFFGDTGSYVFNPKTVGYERLMKLMNDVELVIIEATFLEPINAYSDKKFESHKEKKHMFLFELFDVFEKFNKTQFLLIHFSDCYTINDIKHYVNEARKRYKNISAFI